MGDVDLRGGMADGTPLRVGAQSLEQKMDALLAAIEKQKDDNAALKSQLRVLQEKLESNQH